MKVLAQNGEMVSLTAVRPANVPARTELEETRELVRALDLFVQNYRKGFKGTSYEPLVEKAASRADNALVEMMRKATDALAPLGGKGDGE